MSVVMRDKATLLLGILLILCLEVGRATPSVHGGGGSGLINTISSSMAIISSDSSEHALHDKSRPQDDESFLFNEIDDDVNCKLCPFLSITFSFGF